MRIKQLIWSAFFIICTLFGLYAFYMGGLELLSLLGIVTNAPHRALPLIFVLHSFAGGAALLSGPWQFNRYILNKKRRVHRILGRIYVGAIWITALGALLSALYFDVTPTAKIGFVLLAILWFSSTTIALLHIRQRQIQAHRAWMFRSFALSFFFVTFPFWTAGLASTTLPTAIGYPLAIFLSWSLNLFVAEVWIRYTRPQATLKVA